MQFYHFLTLSFFLPFHPPLSPSLPLSLPLSLPPSPGHAECVDYMRRFNLPIVLVGGGGYTIRNVARCWTYETSTALNCVIANGMGKEGRREGRGGREKGVQSEHNKFLFALFSLSLSFSLLELPYNDYFEYFGPDFKLHISPTNMTNQNSPEYLEKIKVKLFENLRLIPAAPSVQMQRE